jgi:transglutaminase-like putative cysteine protease
MTTSMIRPAPPAPAPPVPPRRPLPWVTAVAAGVSLLLAGVPVSAVVQGDTWFLHGAAVVAAVVAVGLLLHRAGPLAVAAGQIVVVLLLLTGLYTDTGVLGVVPGPATWGRFGALVTGAGAEISTGIAPVTATPQILFLVTAAFGMVAIAVYLAAVTASAPAAGGVPLLAMFAVPAALDDNLLPWWALVGAAAGFGLLLLAPVLARTAARHQLPGGVALVVCSVVLALVAGMAGSFIGTSGRFDGGSGGGAGGSIGLSPFTALRGQLSQADRTELFRVTGLPQPTYLRALTLSSYVPNSGWQATRPGPGPALPGTVLPSFSGDTTTVSLQNMAFRDYWLPVYGTPVGIDGLPAGQWTYDPRSGTAYTARPRADQSWQERTSLAVPTAEQLRAAGTNGTPGAEYLDVRGVDPRVSALAEQVTRGATTAFDKTMALQEYFTGPSTQFRYSLQTAPGAGDDALVEFLTVGKAGYCEQFASAMAVMLRAVGVPARVAVGFTGGTRAGDYESISTSDAHAWVEAWFPNIGWTTFDPTPLTDGRTITPPYVAEAEAQADPTGSQRDGEVPTPDQAPSPTVAPPTPQQTPTDPTRPAAAPGLPAWPLVLGGALLLVVLATVAPALLRSRERRRRLAAADGGGPDAAGAAWAELLAESADRGVTAPPSDTVRAGARRLVREHDLGAEAQQALRQVVGAVEASWYGDRQPAPGELAAPVQVVRDGIAAARALTLRERLLPRSVTNGTLLGRRRTRSDQPETTRV